MNFGLNENGKFFVEYTACTRPVGNVRQEMEIACRQLADEGKILISLSGGLDSQVLLHTYHTLGLPYKCAFLYHPGYNEVEYQQIKILEKKYNFKAIVVTMDVDKRRDEVEQLSFDTGIPPEHHIMCMFLKQLPDDMDFLQGIDSPDIFTYVDGHCYCLESWNSMALARIRALEQVERKGRIVAIDRRAKFNEFALAYLADPIVDSYIDSMPYFQSNNLISKDSEREVPDIQNWEYYVKPLIFGKYWKNELEYFPKFASQNKVLWISNPSNMALLHNYKSQCVYMKRERLIYLLEMFGSNKSYRWIEN